MFSALESASKKRIIENEICKINSILQQKFDFEENLFNHFCGYFGPHTAYFHMDSKSSFMSSLSKEQLSLELNVSLNDRNEIIVLTLGPNDPAFQTGVIKKGDQIISISNLKQTLQVSCATVEAISNMILSDANKKIMLTLRRSSSKYFELVVEKKLLKDEGNTVYSFIVDHKKRRYGYVKIPSFYADFEGNSVKGCAEDAALEVLKLLKNSMQGIIIDLMDNGGGSIEEAIKLARMFIDYDPISIILNNKNVQTIIHDPYPGVTYNNPLVILINENSASASEFFASALQDYNRALLLGSATVSKATMQSIMSLEPNDVENFVKVSINKFYRVTGKSNQATGIVPNVMVPEIYESIYPKEKNNATAFKNDCIATPLIFKRHMKNSAMAKIAKRSTDRIDSNSYFNKTKEFNKEINDLIDTPKLAQLVNMDSAIKSQSEIRRRWEEIKELDTKSINLLLNNYLLTVNPLDKANNKFHLEVLKKTTT